MCFVVELSWRLFYIKAWYGLFMSRFGVALRGLRGVDDWWLRVALGFVVECGGVCDGVMKFVVEGGGIGGEG